MPIAAVLWLLLGFVATVGLGGCEILSPSPLRAPATREPERVLIHSWTPTPASPVESWGGPRTRLYTYVLSGDAGGSEASSSTVTRQRAREALEGLLHEIQASQPTTAMSEPDLLREANQFVLPAHGYDKGAFRLEHYDFQLAAGYISWFKIVLAETEIWSRLDRLGPFLVAARKPLAELVNRHADGTVTVEAGAPLLIVDMSDAHPKAAPAYMNAFKDAVRGVMPTETMTLEPFRARLASLLLTTNEALPFVAEAYAGTRKMLLPTPSANKPPP